MEWRDQGFVLGTRKHGETSVILEAMTEAHGRHIGIVRGGAGRRLGPVLQPGTQLELVWRARLESHMGHFMVEPLHSRNALMADRMALAALNAMRALLSFCLPEREPHAVLYRHSQHLLDLLDRAEVRALAYMQWEKALLEATGFGLDLNACAVTGRREGLAYVSPRTGRAVSEAGAGAWRNRLLPLPACLQGQGQGPGQDPVSDADIVAALHTIGYFLRHRMAACTSNRPLPEARDHFVHMFDRKAHPIDKKSSITL